MINKLLSTAIKFYLRSQVEQVQQLEVGIVGKNRQIMQGYIPQVWLKCDRAIYRGLYLNQVAVKGTNIGFNLGEVLKQQPFKLLEPILVEVELQLNSPDLQASLASKLLQSGLNDLWGIILATESTQINSEVQIQWQKIAIADRVLNIVGIYQDTQGKIKQLHLSTGIALANSHTLNLAPLEITADSLATEELRDSVSIDLGKDIVIEQLAIESKQILCAGKITINN